MKQLFTILLVSALLSGAYAQDVRTRSAGEPQAQPEARRISGRVLGADNEPLVGATVQVVNRNTGATITGTYTDANGNYTVSVPDPAVATVRISYINYADRNIPANSADGAFNVSLQESENLLKEVVVSAFGIEKPREIQGVSSTTISNEVLTQAGNPNALASLQGKVPGARITQSSGSVGGSIYVLLRGGSSLTGNNQPLFVVNGVPIDNSTIASTSRLAGADPGSAINDINPNDIESLEVLQGPAAAALYGSRAANGVVMITTKGSRMGAVRKKFEVTINSNITFERPFRLPEYQNDYAEGDGGTYIPGNGSSWGPRAVGQRVENWDNVFNGLGPDSINLRTYPDNVKDFFETGVTTTNNVSLDGANETANYRVSLGHTQTKGIYPNTEWNRYNVGVTGNMKLSNHLTARWNLNYVRSGSPNRTIQGQDRSSLGWQLQYMPRSLNITDLKDYTLPGQPNTQRNYGTFFDNPYWSLNKNTYSDTRERVFGNVAIEYEVLDWINIMGRVGSDVYSDRRMQRYAKGSLGVVNGSFVDDNNFVREINADLIVTTKPKTIYGDFGVRGTLGINARQNEYRFVSVTATNLIAPNIYAYGNAVTTTPTDGGNTTRRFAAFGEVTFNYKSLVYLTGSLRNDWSSTLPISNRSFLYPSTSVAFNFTELDAIKNDVLTKGKIRAAYALVGNDAGAYSTGTFYTRGNNTEPFNFGSGVGGILFPFNGIAGLSVSNSIGNENLKNESVSSAEIGLDLEFFRGRAFLNTTVYENTTTDLIYNVSQSPTTGFTSRVLNAGKLRTRGIDIAAGGTPIRTRDFTWDINGTFTKYDKRVISLSENVQFIGLGGFAAASSQGRVGEKYPTIFGSRYLRDGAGNLIVTAQGVPQADPVSASLGTAQPDYLWSLQNTFTYKGISLGILIDASIGGKLWSQTVNTLRFSGQVVETLPYREGGYVVSGVKADGTPNDISLTQQEYQENQALFIGERALFDATWVKLREIRLGYALPSNWLERTPFGSVSVAAVGRNLALLHSFIPHIDPETSLQGATNGQGLEYGNLITTRSIGVDLRITF